MTAFLYDLAYVIPLCLAVALLSCKPLGIGVEGNALYITAVLAGSACAALRHLKAKYKAVVLGVLLAGLLGIWLVSGREAGESFLAQHVGILQLTCLCAALFLLEKLAQHYRKIKIAMAAGGMLLLMVLLFMKYAVERSVVGMLFFYAMLTLCDEIHRYGKREGKVEEKRYLVRILPFPLLFLCVFLLLKAPAKPYDWAFAREIYRSVKLQYELILQSFNREKGWDSEEAAIGFSEEAHLGGRIGGDPYPAITFTANRAGDRRLYLGGKSFDRFDGRNWYKEDASATDYQRYDLLQTLSAVLAYDPDHVFDYLDPVYATLSYTGVRTSRIFLPGKGLIETKEEELHRNGGDLLFAGPAPDSYRLRYYRLNRSYEGMEALLQAGVVADEVVFEEAKKQLGLRDNAAYSYAGMLEYEQEILKIYGPEQEVSEEVGQLLERELDGAVNDADKLDRIEALLSAMQYSSSPGALPDSVDSASAFLDYLLLEKKEGYCSHFATAFVLLARAEGIPARYVQGYSVPAGGLETVLMSDCGHAWPEAYVDGVGWIVYEPTPGYRRESGWETEGKNTSAEESSGYEEEGASYYSEYCQEEEGEDQSIEESERKKMDPRIILVPLAMAALFLFLFFVAERLIRLTRYRKMGEEEKLRSMGKQTLKLLKRHGFSVEQGETLSEFYQRLVKSIPAELLAQLPVYETVLYAGKEASAEDMAVLEMACRGLRRYLWKQSWGRVFPILLKFSNIFFIIALTIF